MSKQRKSGAGWFLWAILPMAFVCLSVQSMAELPPSSPWEGVAWPSLVLPDELFPQAPQLVPSRSAGSLLTFSGRRQAETELHFLVEGEEAGMTWHGLETLNLDSRPGFVEGLHRLGEITLVPASFPGKQTATKLFSAWIAEEESGKPQLRISFLSETGRAIRPSLRVDSGTDRPLAETRLAAVGDELIVVWQESVSDSIHTLSRRSRDGGVTWLPAVTLSENGSSNHTLIRTTEAFYFFDSVSLGNIGRRSFLLMRMSLEQTEWNEVQVPSWSSPIRPMHAVAACSQSDHVGIIFQTATELLTFDGVFPNPSWSIPVRVTQVDAEVSSLFEPHLACDSQGNWIASWLTGSEGNPAANAFVAYRFSDHEKWSEAFRVNPQANSVYVSDIQSLSLASADDGYTYLAWSDTRGGNYPQVIGAVAIHSRHFLADPEINPLHLQVIANPSASPSFRLQTNLQGKARVSVYDVKGRRLNSWTENVQGEQTNFTWSGEETSGRRASNGVYLIRVEMNGYQASQKCLLHRR